jgi:hypothetical protein
MRTEKPITIERLDAAIAFTAYAMQRHNLPQLLPTLKRLEAARDDLLVNGDALEYAKRAFERVTIEVRRNVPSLQNYNIDTNQTSMHDAS